MSLRAAVDIGGTFTDVQVLNTDTGQIWDFKTPTTPEDPSKGLIVGLSGAAQRAGALVGDIGLILHGSTIATNAVLERRLPKGALLTTAGFEDVLEIGRHMRRDVYALRAEPRTVLIPAERRIGIKERIRADGTVETSIDPEEVTRIGQRLVDEGVATVAIMFLHAYRNPSHEIAAAEALTKISGLTVATSFETSPEMREFERASTTVLNALLKPVIYDYLAQVESRLSDAGITAPLFLVQSNGGVATPAETARLPVRLLLSGPSGGAMAVAEIARRHALPNVVGVDMGGTSTDVSVVNNGTVEETAAGEIDGLPVRLPMIEIRTIGAGGGSIARVEDGALRVGPHSAGSRPGPACYQRGGTKPTVTDANLALGRIDPAGFLGGQMQLGTREAGAVISAVAKPLDLTHEQTAGGIVAVANAAMAAAVRLSLFEKGADPSDFTLASFGGAGGLHACEIAEQLDIRGVLFPATASTLSARGMLGTDLRHDLSEAQLIILSPEAAPVLTEMIERLTAQADSLLAGDSIEPKDRIIEILADLRYRGQAFEITTPWPGAESTDLNALTDEFHSLHQQRYAHADPTQSVELVALRARATGRMPRPVENHAETPAGGLPSTSRAVWQDGWADTAIAQRADIGAAPLQGPLLIQEDYAVLWLPGGWAIHALPGGDLMAERTNA